MVLFGKFRLSRLRHCQKLPLQFFDFPPELIGQNSTAVLPLLEIFFLLFPFLSGCFQLFLLFFVRCATHCLLLTFCHPPFIFYVLHLFFLQLFELIALLLKFLGGLFFLLL